MLPSRLAVLAAAILFSTGGAAIKACGLGPWQVTGFRSAVAGVAIAVLLGSGRETWSRRTALTAVAYAVTMILFVAANKLTTAASTIFLQSTAPLYMILFARFVLDERIRPRDLVFLAILAGGLVLLVQDDAPRFTTAPDPARGNLLAALCAVSWALTVGGLRWIERDAPDARASSGALVLGNALAFVACLPFSFPLGPTTPFDWGLVGWLGLFQVGLAYVCLARGVRRVPGIEASLLLLLEPVLSPLWAWLVHGEAPGRWSLAGGVLILVTTAVKVAADSRPPAPFNGRRGR